MSHFIPAVEHENFEGTPDTPAGLEEATQVFRHAKTGIQIRIVTFYMMQTDSYTSRVDVFYPPGFERYDEAAG